MQKSGYANDFVGMTKEKKWKNLHASKKMSIKFTRRKEKAK